MCKPNAASTIPSRLELPNEAAMIEITSGDGHSFSAYRAEPTETPKGGVVALQDFSGVSAHIRKEVDSFARNGYVAVAPALFDREKKGVVLGYDENSVLEGERLAKTIAISNALQDIQAAVNSVKSAGKVAIVGYSWGGYLAYLSANRLRDIACAIGYYGPGISLDRWEKRKIPTLLHFGEKDPLISLEEIVQFRADRPDVSAFCYPEAGHGFNCDEGQSYDAEAAQIARERTMLWISQFVEGQPPVALKNAGAYAQARTEKKKKKSSEDDMGAPME
jgi:carboxymethylenebutenolidase